MAASVWAIASHHHHNQLAHSGRTGLIVSLMAGLLTGAAPGLANFFLTAGGGVH